MNDVYPEIHSATIGEAPAGSLAVIPHHDGPLLVLVSDQSIQKDLRSIVLLNLNYPNSTSVQFHENWGIQDSCLYYKTPLRFELSNKTEDIATNAKWWRTPGVIASLQNDFFIRAAAPNRGGFRYVNVKTGAMFSGDMPNFFVLFGVWSIWLRDPTRERSSELFNFDIHSQGRNEG